MLCWEWFLMLLFCSLFKQWNPFKFCGKKTIYWFEVGLDLNCNNSKIVLTWLNTEWVQPKNELGYDVDSKLTFWIEGVMMYYSAFVFSHFKTNTKDKRKKSSLNAGSRGSLQPGVLVSIDVVLWSSSDTQYYVLNYVWICIYLVCFN